METLAQFVLKWTGKKVDFDGMYGAQCVDLVEQYLKDVLNFAPLMGNAINEFGENPNHWTWIKNDLSKITQIPARGDVMIWGADARIGTSVLGHTAIVLEADFKGFTSFDQNWPLNAAPHQVRHTYQGIVGWGVPKPLLPKPINPPLVSPAPVRPLPVPVPQEVPPVTLPVIDIPEPQAVAEAGVSTSEWKLAVAYAVQGAAVAVATEVSRVFGWHWDIGSIVQFELVVAIPVASYLVSRGVRKIGTTA